MPELAELKFTSDYVNQVSEGMTYIGLKRIPFINVKILTKSILTIKNLLLLQNLEVKR